MPVEYLCVKLLVSCNVCERAMLLKVLLLYLCHVYLLWNICVSKPAGIMLLKVLLLYLCDAYLLLVSGNVLMKNVYNVCWTAMSLKLLPEHNVQTLVLVFSKCFRAGFYTFSRLQFKVNKGTNSCNLCLKIMTKTYLVFISMVTIHSACHC